MKTTFKKLTEKDVINCIDGSFVGTLEDIELSTDDCKVTAISVSIKSSIFCKSECITIPWCQIEKIGCDVIIVNCQSLAACCRDEHEPKPKRFFLS